MKLIQKFLTVTASVAIMFSLVLPLVSSAQGVVPQPCDVSGKICNPISQNTLEGFLKNALEGVIRIGLPIIALAIIYCGFLFVKARGNTEELTKAKDALLYTLIGAAILLGAWALAQLIQETVNAL